MAAIIVEPIPGGWHRFRGALNLDARQVARLIDTGTWGMAELAEHGLIQAVPFTVPAGMIRVGQERFEAEGGHVVQVYDTEPAPDPLLVARQTAVLRKAEFFSRLLAMAQADMLPGLTSDDIVTASGGVMPVSIGTAMAGTMTEAEMQQVQVTFKAAVDFERLDPILALFAAAIAGDQADTLLDALFEVQP